LTIRDPSGQSRFYCYDVERRRIKIKRTLLRADRFDRWVDHPMTFVNDIFSLTAKLAAPQVAAKINVARRMSILQPSGGDHD
jgi:hypothetical protein